jgi:hypothetical protein
MNTHEGGHTDMKQAAMIRGLAAMAFAVTAALAAPAAPASAAPTAAAQPITVESKVAAPAAAAQPMTVESMLAAANKCSTKSIYLPNKARRVVSLKYIECKRTYKGKKQSSTAMWLWDNKPKDKICAVGRTDIRNGKKNWHHSWGPWCNNKRSSPKYISGWHNGADAKVRLFAVKNKKG